jgi:hypothetical protein
MDNITVDRDDIDALAQALDNGTLPAQDLLRSLVTAILSAAGAEDSISVSVEVETSPETEVETLRETFEAAFVPEPSPDVHASGHAVRVTVAKIGR